MQSLTRKEKRSHLHKSKFIGESKNYHLTVIGQNKFKRVLQIINPNKQKVKDKKGNIMYDLNGLPIQAKPKKIYHYLLQ